MARKKAQPAANTDDMSVMEWWWRSYPMIECEPVATDGLSKRRDELEAIVEPYVTTRKTRDAVLFKGKRRYVKAKLHGVNQESNRAWAAIFALQCLYNIEGAISAGNMNAVIQCTHGFTLFDLDVKIIERCGWDADAAVTLWELDRMIAVERRQNQAKGPLRRRGQSKLQEHDDLIKTLQSKYKDEHRYMKLMLKDLSDKRVVASDDTLRTRIKHLGLSRK